MTIQQGSDYETMFGHARLTGWSSIEVESYFVSVDNSQRFLIRGHRFVGLDPRFFEASGSCDSIESPFDMLDLLNAEYGRVKLGSN